MYVREMAATCRLYIGQLFSPGEFARLVKEYSIDGVNLFASLIRRGDIGMCAYRLSNEPSDCTVQYVVKYGLTFDKTDLQRFLRNSITGLR